VKIVYSPKYEVDVDGHPFRMEKYRLIKERLLTDGFQENDFVEPQPAGDAEILLVHTDNYVYKLNSGQLSAGELHRLEIKFSPELAEAAWMHAGGSLMAGRLALRDGACYHDGGGFHHAFPDHGEGFCVINDHSVAISKLLLDRTIRTAMVIDCDNHQANGTASIFSKNPDVFTFSIHEQDGYPFEKPPSDMDFGLDMDTGDEEYLGVLEKGMTAALKMFQPDLMFYVAGADTYIEDELGGLGLTIAGMKTRDEMVIGAAKERGIPIASVLAGGYAPKVDDLVTIHANTALVMRDMLG
jgi:acetoin utilization deacetylase AcuC-like enzyme